MITLFVLLIFFISLSPAVIANDEGEIDGAAIVTDPKDKKVLVEFYHKTAGPAWFQNTSWLSGDPCQSAWYGIACNQEGHIISITLPNNKLAGELPSSMGEIQTLKVLQLHNNAIGGAPLEYLLTIKSLQILDLANNQFDGALPDSLSMPYITNLSLAHNHFEGNLPTEWAAPLLQSLELQSNTFDGSIPNALSALSSLKYMDLSQNLFYANAELPSALGQLTSLETLLLFTNQFHLAEIPSTWSKLTKMKNFQADRLAGDIPEFIGSNWLALEQLIIVDGNLTGEISTSYCQLSNLKYFHVFRNQITGHIPDCLCKATGLVSINLSYNKLIGSLPNCFHTLENLEYLYMENNGLTGTLPQSLSYCSKLYAIDLSDNKLTGTVPSSYASLSSRLNWFELENNNLNGFDDGLEEFFRSVDSKFCSLYGNPWGCPLPSYFYDGEFCNVRDCSKCNTVGNHTSCRICVSNNCGWCKEGPNCLEGYTGGPWYPYNCATKNWIYNTTTGCDN